MMSKKILLTGDRPTGKLHLGHYAGSLKKRLEIYEQYESYIMVADVQALTDNFNNPQKVRDNVFEVVADNLAIGIDPNKATFFIQSEIPQIAELTVFFSNLVTISELKRNPTVKTEIKEKERIFGHEGEHLTFGFLGYPVSQAADITFINAEVVPVGEDQKPMLELTRQIVRKFNNLYGQTFKEPKEVLDNISRLQGLDGKKMSKSLNNAIYLSDSREEIEKKIRKAVTDSENKVYFDPEKKPGVSNLMTYYQIVSGKSYNEIEDEFKDIKYYIEFKEKLIDKLDHFLKPFRERRREFENNPEKVWKVLREGKEKVLKKAEENMKIIRKNMKIDYFL